MKSLLLASAFFLGITASFATEVATDEAVNVALSKYKSWFVFKAKKKFVGATIEIYSSNGQLITAQHLLKRKMIINFGDARYDTYTIRIAKGNYTQEFQYVKK